MNLVNFPGALTISSSERAKGDGIKFIKFH